MNNQLMKKEDISFLDRVKSFIKNIFCKKNVQNEFEEVKYTEKTQEIEKNNFEENLKTEISNDFRKEYDLKKFIKEIEKDPTILEKLSSDRLDKLIAYYEKIISEKKDKLQSLKVNQ